MNAYTRRLQRIEAATGDPPKSVKDMTDRQLIRLIVGGDGTQHITDGELKRIINRIGAETWARLNYG